MIVSVAVACALAAHPSARQAPAPAPAPPLIEQFLARQDPPPFQYRALRHLDAASQHFGVSAWMDAWTEVDREHGFRIEVVAEGGSGYVRSHVLRAALEGEQKMFLAGEPAKAALTRVNYEFHQLGPDAIGITPRRKDVLLVIGTVFVKPDDADMVKVEGRLSKTPSFWTRRVEVVRSYQRVNGIRVPVAIESIAQVLIAGRSTFKMTYEYEAINGEHVGNPHPRTSP